MKPQSLTKQLVSAISITAVLLTLSLSTTACELCTFNRNYMPLENTNSFGIVHSFRVFNGYQSLQQQSVLFPSGAYRLPSSTPIVQDGDHGHATNLMSPTDFESFKVIEARARYFIHPKIETNIHIPFVNNKQEWLGIQSHIFGLGDVSVSVGYHFIEQLDSSKFRQRGIVGIGIELPTGNCSYEYGDGDRIPLYLQGGSGSFGGTAFASWSGAYQDWIWGVTAQGKYHGENKFHERIQPALISTFFITRVQQKKDFTFLPQLLFHQEFSTGYTQYDYLIPGTRSNMILVGAGLETYYRKIGFSLSLQLPIYQEVYYMDMKVGGHFSVGLSYNFGTDKYLLN